MVYTCYMQVVMRLQQSNSAVMEQICWAWVVLIPINKRQATGGVKSFFWEHNYSVCIVTLSVSILSFDSYKIVMTVEISTKSWLAY